MFIQTIYEKIDWKKLVHSLTGPINKSIHETHISVIYRLKTLLFKACYKTPVFIVFTFNDK